MLHTVHKDLQQQSFLVEGTARRTGVASTAVPRHVQTDFEELDDGSLVDIIEDPSDRTRTLLAVYKNGEKGGRVECVERLKVPGKILMPIKRHDEALQHVRLPTGVAEYGSACALFYQVKNLIDQCVTLPPAHSFVVAMFVVSTWISDRLPVAPYLLVTGLPQSGKSTLLKTLALVCRRPMLVGDITPGGLYQTCLRLNPTLLIDEVGSQVGVSQRALFHQLRLGTTRDVIALNSKQTQHSFGPKVLSSVQPLEDPALMSRCVVIPMKETDRPDLRRPTDPDIEETGRRLQAGLLQFRFDAYRTIQPATISGAERLRPRDRDLLSCLAAPIASDEAISKFLLAFFERRQDELAEGLSPYQEVILSVLYHLIHPGCDRVLVGDLAAIANGMFKLQAERLRLEPRKVGAVLTSLGVGWRERSNQGVVLVLDNEAQKEIHRMVRRFGVQITRLGLPLLDESGCSICREIGQGDRQLSERMGKKGEEKAKITRERRERCERSSAKQTSARTG